MFKIDNFILPASVEHEYITSSAQKSLEKTEHLENLREASYHAFKLETKPREVTLTKFKIVNIGKINASKHQFEIDFWFRMKWHDPSLIDNKLFGRTAEEYKALWFPGFEFERHLDCKELWDDDVSFCLKDKNTGLMFYSQRYRITCECLMDVSDFPFDINKLQVQFSSKMYKKDKVVWMLEGGIVTEDWEQGEYDHLGASVVIDDNCTKSHAAAKIVLKVQRKYQYYVFKFISIIFFLNLISITLLLLPKDELNDTFGNFLALLLTHVAFSWILSDHVPVVPYLTILDKYINFSYIMLGLIHIITCASYLLVENSSDDVANKICYASFIIFPITHIAYPTYLFYPAIAKNQEHNLEADALTPVDS